MTSTKKRPARIAKPSSAKKQGEKRKDQTAAGTSKNKREAAATRISKSPTEAAATRVSKSPAEAAVSTSRSKGPIASRRGGDQEDDIEEIEASEHNGQSEESEASRHDGEADAVAEADAEGAPVVWDAAARMAFAQEVLASSTMETFLPFHHVQFVKSAVHPKSYPPPIFPEVAVAGRSNVGKSSLLNSLFQRKSLVKVSKTPGRTQLLNFFEVDRQLMLVDLPGYGFAQVPDAVRRQWQPMIDRYLNKREVLVACLFLLDIRRLPSEEDLELWEWLQHFEMDVIPVLTKADKLSSQQQQKQLHQIAEALDAPQQGLVVTSAKDHKGRDRLRTMLRAYGWQAWQAYATGIWGSLEEKMLGE